MNFRFKFAWGFIAVLLLFFPLSPEAFCFSLEGRVRDFTLENGMKVLMLERHQSPTIALYIRFRVGATDENVGQTGTAHLLEHMLFKGTQTLGTKNYAEEEKISERPHCLLGEQCKTLLPRPPRFFPHRGRGPALCPNPPEGKPCGIHCTGGLKKFREFSSEFGD